MTSKLLVTLVILFMSNVTIAAENLMFSNSHIREPIPGMSKTAAYGELKNLTDQVITLVSVNSNVATKVEYHDHLMTDNVMKMSKLDQIVLQPNETVKFESGGKHIMFFNLKDTSFENVVINLVEDNGKVHTFTLEKRSVKEMHQHSHH